ncbi:hypothetical protein ACFE04_008376 [Oxalis oulophora]
MRRDGRSEAAAGWDGNGSAHIHHLMKALQSSRLLEVACQPRFPSLKTMLLTKCPSGAAIQQRVVRFRTPLPREQDAGRANLYFLAPTSKEKAGAEKEPAQPLQESFAWSGLSTHSDNVLNTKVCSSASGAHAESQAAPRKARTSHMQGNLHVWF